ncbi:NACHT domain-containing protein [Marinobacterium marinum]|uniref:NACHT domain-containing protein n=1 Tax=Marinobacterium marinum TaxID=2756129 RepID=A0A7W2AAW5_9GAMM|nr:RNA-binding domain-containing protein [Marinobacterium marinum]MBA4500862.1 NACHT domain-containing protein [Marinobacterium marinum]
MNGFEFANEALSIKGYELDSIIEITEGEEVDWLEFKAAIQPQDSDEASKFNEADYIFHLVKALVGMANSSSGGLVVLGIDDAGKAIGLEASGFDGDKDKFTRRISSKVLLKEGWRTTKGHWRWKVTADQITFNPQWATYQNIDVLVFAVPPREHALGPLTLTHAASKNSELQDTVFIRVGGDRGQVIQYSREDAVHWWGQRDLTLFSQKFITWIRELQKTDPAVFVNTVRNYCSDAVRDWEEVGRTYVPLEADVWLISNDSTRHRRMPEEDYLLSGNTDGGASKWRGDLQEVVTRVYPAFLTGEPGAGKSTSLREYTRKLCLQGHSEPGTWGVYVPLAAYTASGLRDLICREIPPLNWCDIQLELDAGHLTLVLDGLNECPSSHYDQCVAELSDLLKEHPNGKIIVSTRTSHLPSYARKVIELRSMAAESQQQFVRNHLGDDPDVIQAFWNTLHLKSTAPMIAQSPILLRVAVSVWDDSGDLPGGLAQLYQSFLDSWIRRELSKDLSAGEVAIWSESDIREGLAILAYSMHSDGLVACTAAYAEERLRIVLGDRCHSFITRVVQGLMIEWTYNGRVIRFKHETIQEFLVAFFLVEHSEYELIQAANISDPLRWAMPIAFAFELFDQPPEDFLQSAWRVAPLLVCAAYRDEEALKTLPEPGYRHLAPQNSLWVQGIIRCLRGESVESITQRLSYLGRTPSPRLRKQKHALPQELTAALEGMAFWYSLSSHDNGLRRIERLQHLLIDQRNLWLELLAHVLVAQPGWLIHLTEAQKLLVGELTNDERDQALSEASIAELCFMVRNKIISQDEFRKHWKRALNADKTEPLDSKLLALLAAKTIKASQLNGEQRSLLKTMASNRELSPRILSTLVRDGVVQAAEIRHDPVQINRLVDTVSPIRAKQLVKTGVLRREDFNKQQLESLYNRVNEGKDIQFILEAGLADSRQQIPKSIRDRVHGIGHEKGRTEVPQAPHIRSDTGATKDSGDVLAQIYLSPEQMLLKNIREDMQKPHNFPPGNGYHRFLAEQVEASTRWPLTERKELIDLAEAFFLEHGSKKRRKEYRSLIGLAREALRGA